MRIRLVLPVVAGIVGLALAADALAQESLGLKRLTESPTQDGFPQWSPDGKAIVFSRYGGDEATEMNGLWLVSPDGGEPRRLTWVLAEHPHWSPGGHYIAFDGDFGNTIQLVAATGGTPIRIVPESIPVSRGGQPKWSPDGTRIAFKAGPNVWILDLPSGRLEKIFSEEGKLPIPTFWSRDGEEVFVLMREAEGPHSSIWAISVNGEGMRKVTPDEEGTYRYADLSPDGTLMAVVWCEGRACDIWAMPVGGGKRVPITTHPDYDDGPAWSPDGTRIAFVSTRSGNFDIWTVEVDQARIHGELARLDRAAPD